MEKIRTLMFVLECPFCGSGDVELEGRRGFYWVVCHGCFSSSGSGRTKRDAILLWNGTPGKATMRLSNKRYSSLRTLADCMKSKEFKKGYRKGVATVEQILKAARFEYLDGFLQAIVEVIK